MMQVTLGRATTQDLEQAMHCLSDQTATEIARLPVDRADWQEWVRGKVREGDAFVSASGDRILTVFGFHDLGDYYSMWSIGTRAYFDSGVPGVLATRRFFRTLRMDKPLAVVTTSPHPDLRRWLELLGFEHVGPEGPAEVFLYAPETCGKRATGVSVSAGENVGLA